MTTVFVADAISQSGLDILRSKPGVEVVVKTGLSEADLCAAIGDSVGLVVRSATKVTRKVMEAAPKLRIIGRAGVGVDNIDVPAATERKVLVVNSPGGNITSAAEHAVALMFAVARWVPQADAKLKAGHWDKKSFVGNELSGKTLGVIGIGRVARILVRVARSMDMNILFFDPFVEEAQVAEFKAKKVDLPTLMAGSDYVSVHAQLTPETKNLIGADLFAKSKPGQILINCARGGIVDEAALAEAIKGGRVAGAGLDVFATEPCTASPLFGLDRVVVTPHLGASTAEAQDRVADDVARLFLEYFDAGTVSHSVNKI